MGTTVRTRPQLGTEKDPTPLPPLHARPGTGALVRARLSIWVTMALWALYVFTAALTVLRGDNGADVADLLSTLTYVFVITLLTFSSIMYLLARSGAISRFNTHTRVPRRSIDDHFAHRQPPLTVLVPSYAEEPNLVRQALLSAALQEYPRLEVVLLIDDAPDPADSATHERLELTRALPDEIAALLAEPLDQARTAMAAHDAALRDGWCDAHAEMARVAEAYHAAATWLRLTAEEEPNDDNVDAFLREASSVLSLASCSTPLMPQPTPPHQRRRSTCAGSASCCNASCGSSPRTSGCSNASGMHPSPTRQTRR